MVHLSNHITDAVPSTKDIQARKPKGKAFDTVRVNFFIGFVLTFEYTPSHVTIDFAGDVVAAADL